MTEIQDIIIPLLTGLIGFLGKAWIDNRKRKKDNFHQLSITTYQKLFERKVSAYNKLASISFKFTKFDTEYSKSIQQADIEERTKMLLIQTHYNKIYQTYLEFETVIQDDFIILSPKLGNAYLDWQLFLYQESKSVLKDLHQLHASEINAVFEGLETGCEQLDYTPSFEKVIQGSNTKSSELRAFVLGEIIELNSDRFNQLVELIKNDILKINKRINEIDL